VVAVLGGGFNLTEAVLGLIAGLKA
jgi:hypothetical protein